MSVYWIYTDMVGDGDKEWYIAVELVDGVFLPEIDSYPADAMDIKEFKEKHPEDRVVGPLLHPGYARSNAFKEFEIYDLLIEVIRRGGFDGSKYMHCVEKVLKEFETHGDEITVPDSFLKALEELVACVEE